MGCSMADADISFRFQDVMQFNDSKKDVLKIACLIIFANTLLLYKKNFIL